MANSDTTERAGHGCDSPGLEVRISPYPALKSLLERHPFVAEVCEAEQDSVIDWTVGTWARRLYRGHDDVSLRGVVELTDNNPLVCADSFSVPGPVATLAVLALGPLIEAGVLTEQPTLLSNVHAEEAEVTPYLEPMGWHEGVIVGTDPTDLGGVIAATVVSSVATPARLDDLDDLFEERYGRSFYVRRDESTEWHVRSVLGRPFALYRLRISPDEPNSLLTVQIMSDPEGKSGAAQIVHAFNVMCGFEESLGIGE